MTQDDGLFLVLKLDGDSLDLTSRRGAFHYKAMARAYNTQKSAKTQATMYRNTGFTVRVAEVTVVDGHPHIEWTGL